jgi:hypothetical protein
MLHLNTIYIRKTEFHRLRELAPGDGKRGPPAQRLTTNAKYEVRPSWATPSSSPHTSLRYSQQSGVVCALLLRSSKIRKALVRKRVDKLQSILAEV